MKYLLAIDAGTGSVRAVVFDTKGNQISVGQTQWTHLQEEGVPNSMSFDFRQNWTLVCGVIKKAIKEAKISSSDILALSATSMREGIVLYDKEGNELWGVANVDARADKEVRFLKENFPKIEDEFYRLSGQTFALGALPRLLWLKNNRADIYTKVAKISMISDWVLAKLCSVIATDPSNGGTTGIFSLNRRDWQADMAARVGLKDTIFPPCYETGTVLGRVLDQVCQLTGLSPNTKVVTGGGDVQLGCAGLGVVNAGDTAVLGGSFWQQVVNIPSLVQPPKDMSIRVNPHVVKNLSQAEGITFFSGLVMRWFRDAFCQTQKEQAAKLGIDTYTLLEQQAKDVPVGSYGIIPIFSDSMNYKNWYHGAPSFLNLTLDASKSNPVSIFRSLEENAAIVSSLNLERIEKFTGININIIVFAGGASKGTLWPQILADVTGCVVNIPKVTEATALGAAMAAGIGAGIYDDLVSAAKELVVWQRSYTPDLNNKKLYDDIKIKFQKAYKKQLELVDEGVTLSMWKAPGL